MLSHLRNIVRVKDPGSTPLQLIHFVTNVCNLTCGHCFYWKELNSKEPELDLDQLDRIISSIPAPLELAVLAGGEPFLNKDLPRICELYSRKNRTRTITVDTNGHHTDKIVAMTEEILTRTRSKLHLQLSLDGPEDLHNDIRNSPESYRNAVATLRALKAVKHKRLTLNVVTVIGSKNLDAAGKMHEVVGEGGVGYSYGMVRGSSYGIVSDDPSMDFVDFNPMDEELPLSQAEVRELLEVIKQDTRRSFWQRALIDYRSIPMSYLIIRYSEALLEKRKWMIECLAGRAVGVLYPSGEVALCEFTAPIANLHELDYDFARAWSSPRANELREKVKGCSCIHGCWVYPSLVYSPRNLVRFARVLLTDRLQRRGKDPSISNESLSA